MLSYFLLAALPLQAFAQVTGTATGFATGVTGGGDATPAIPSDTAEYVETVSIIMLSHKEPQTDLGYLTDSRSG